MTQQPADGLSDRIRTALADRNVREVRMFGANCFMVDDAMAVAANEDGSLLVHVDRSADPQHLQKPRASRAEMGTGRSTRPGWIRIAPQGITRDDDLRDWIEAALTRTPTA